jgi:class 3 adenylate cyclase/tetratricopeptide (TPR) repeat protein
MYLVVPASGPIGNGARVVGYLPSPPMGGESSVGAGRSTAIVLFTDLVGSTELRSRLGEEAAEEVRRRHDSLVAGAIDTNRGRVIKHLGDGVMATFTGAADALAACVAVQQALDHHNRSGSAVHLAVRIGVSAGDVAVEEADCFGTPVIEAARLCGVAGGGQILASDIVRALAGSAGGHEFRPVGPLDLKGLPAPVPACEVAWEPLPLATVPMPALLTDTGRVFVAREDALEGLGQVWKEAASGDRRVALLAGEPGVGKTRLAAELACQVHDQGATVLAGRCDEDLGVPYQPFVEALRHFVEHASAEDLGAGLGRYAGELVRLVPEIEQRVSDLAAPLRSDPETERYRLFDAVAAWLGASIDRPVLLVLDDLQWAAKPTLLLLRHVIRSPEPKRLMILGTYRDTELGHDHPLIEILADLRREGGMKRLSLGGLDSSGVAAFMEQAAGHALDDEDLSLARAIHEETEGNPFFVREVLRHLGETGAVERRDGRWATRLPVEEVGIPEGVRDVVGRRLSRLSEEANRVLRVAAVVGPEFELSVLQRAEALDEEDLLSAIEEATAARLVLEVAGPIGRYRFAHALVRGTLYDALSAARRVTLHRRVAEAIEAVHVGRLDDYLPALAHHYARASAPAAVTGKAVAYAARAGARALAQLAHDEGAGYYRQALELLDAGEGPVDESQRLELLIAFGEAQKRAGDSAHRNTLLDAAHLAEGQGNAASLARAVLANSRGHLPSIVGGVDTGRVSMLEAALAAGGKDDSPTRARVLAILALELTFAPDRHRCLELSDEALAMARRLEDSQTLSHVLLARYFAIMSPDTLSECLSNTEELLRVVAVVPDPAMKCRAYTVRYRLLMDAGDAAEADRLLEPGDRLAAELGQPALQWTVKYVPQAGRALIAGRLGDAERLAHEGRMAGGAGNPDAELCYAAQLSLIRFEEDRLDEVESVLARTLADLAARHARLPFLESLMAVAHCELGQKEKAAAILDRLASVSPPLDLYWLTTAAHWATSAAHLGDAGQCQRMFEMLEPYCDRAVAYILFPTASVAHHLGLLATSLGRYEEAERQFRSAEEVHARVGAPLYVARTRLEWARMLLARRAPEDAARARDLLGQALASARDLGLANIERHAVALLA